LRLRTETPSSPFLNQNSTSLAFTVRPLRAEELGYFDPESKTETSAKTIVCSDVYLFTERLSQLALSCGEQVVRDVFPTCLRGPALYWHSAKLTALE